ncbi:T-cell surface glycoprotein CD3 epsilon chain-like isoform X2 [Antennarius striatus]|uniref:T-cell surface glycoprotein CD3 epsilon chain-like isoform X2 n=1 Tax=Antennarius striatus TaxID=241820 RepID=UPI0035B2B813
MSGSVSVAFFILLFLVPVEAESGGVTFWRKQVTMTCPGDGTWFQQHGGGDTPMGRQLVIDYQTNERSFYRCEFDNRKYFFYVQGKVCDDCYELDAALLGAIVTVDVAMTTVVMMIVYRCSKRKSDAGFSHPSKAPVHNGGRAPPVPSPDYEGLSPHTQSQDIYSKMRGM